MARAQVLALTLFLGFATPAASEAFNLLRSGLVAEGDARASLSQELAARTSNTSEHKHLEKLKEGMATMFTSLPKNRKGKLTHQAVRYALHRDFVHRYGWSIRGLEPNNDTWHSAPDPNAHNSSKMKEWVPSYLQDVLEQTLHDDGADLVTLASLAAALEDLIRQETVGRLEMAYRMSSLGPKTPLTKQEADEVIETFYIAFLNFGDFAASPSDLKYQKEQFISKYVGWPQAEEWLQELLWGSLVRPQGSEKHSFDSLAEVLNKISEEYHSLNDKECRDLKRELQGMQGRKPGRVRLAKFYSGGMYTHWDFTEKKEYLRTLGALDESDAERPSVIIANYVMSRSNCLDASNLYTICCRNECEDLMGVLEGDIGSAQATPAHIVKLVSSMASDTVTAPLNLSASLSGRLDEIAAYHGGEVPLHGRLFAQWMHNVYPLECPYPHELGTVNPQSPNEWISETGHAGVSSSADEMMEHVARDSCAITAEGGVDCAEESAELAWNSAEELLTWEPKKVSAARAPSVQNDRSASTPMLACFGLAALAIAMLALAPREDDNGKGRRRRLPLRWPLTIGVLALLAYAAGVLDGRLFLCILGCGVAVVTATRAGGSSGALKRAPGDKCCV